MSKLNNVLYTLTGLLMKPVTSSLKVSELPYYDMIEELGSLSLQYEGLPNNKMMKQMKLLTPILKKLSGNNQPMYMTPKEIVQKLPELTITQLSTELLWLSNLYY